MLEHLSNDALMTLYGLVCHELDQSDADDRHMTEKDIPALNEAADALSATMSSRGLR